MTNPPNLQGSVAGSKEALEVAIQAYFGDEHPWYVGMSAGIRELVETGMRKAIEAYLAATTLPPGAEGELVGRIRHLVSLDDPKNGGPYGGSAATACLDAMLEAADLITTLSAERDEAKGWARKLTKALTGLTANGSEFFTRAVRLGEYYADVQKCVEYIRNRYESQHSAIIEAIKARKAAESSLAEAQLRIAGLEAALHEIAAFHDVGASKYLADLGSYGGFDEPGSVEIARRALSETGDKPQ